MYGRLNEIVKVVYLHSILIHVWYLFEWGGDIFCDSGGKWTTYRLMAEETVDECVKVCKLPQKRACVTKGLLIEGAHNYTPTTFIRLIQDFGIDNRVTFILILITE